MGPGRQTQIGDHRQLKEIGAQAPRGKEQHLFTIVFEG
jgi:hypothetical protein